MSAGDAPGLRTRSVTAGVIGSRRRGAFRLTGAAIYVPLIALIALRFAPGVPTVVAFAAVAGYALLNRANAIVALMLSWLFTLSNPGLTGDAGGGGAERYLVMLAAFASVVFHSLRDRFVRPDAFVAATVLLVVFFVGHSIFLSPVPSVSILKALSWGVAMLTSLCAWLSLDEQRRQALAERVFWLLVALMVVSLPLLVAPVGYLRNGSGFQGVLSHPQTFGLTMATLTAWSAARLLETAKPSWIQVAITGLALVMVVLSQARTGGLAMLVGLMLAIAITVVVKARRLRLVAPGLLTRRFWGLAFLGFLAGLGAVEQLWRVVQGFLLKRGGNSASLLDIYDASRGTLIDLMLANIASDPWRGIGFGIASIPSLMRVEENTFFGLPVGATVEKGMAPLAVLEEVGVLGFVLVIVWLGWLTARAAQAGLAPLAVLLTILALNFGENTFFSAGGHGLLGIILLGWVYAAAERARRV